VLLGGLDEQEDAAHVDVEDGREGLDGGLGETRERGDGGRVVDDDVDGPSWKSRERGVDDVLALCHAAGVGLHGGAVHAQGADGGDVLEGGFFAGVVVEDDLGEC
jgi:hypothetical protein